MNTPTYSPFDLQCTNTLAGIANSERISTDVRKQAEGILSSLLTLLSKDVQKLSLESNGIQLTT